MNHVKLIRFWSMAVGSMDAITGLLLIFIPEKIVKLLQVPPLSAEALVYLSWIGVFVMSVGLSYALALGRRGQGEATWMFTTLVRISVALFLTVQILNDRLPAAWALVAVSDALVATVQIFILRAGWWQDVRQHPADRR